MDPLTPSSRLKLENQVAVVTGGAQGIGAGIVRRFVQEGARVVFSDLSGIMRCALCPLKSYSRRSQQSPRSFIAIFLVFKNPRGRTARMRIALVTNGR